MSKSCGIHIGQRRFAVVVLDGSAKKHKVILQEEGEIPLGEDPILGTAAALKAVAKKVKVPGENVGLAVDSGLAAYRTLSLPFDDKSKIEDVVKFEVESQLPQWDIDDVIVDFLTLSSTPGVESNLLITAVPKDRLEARIRACERAGLEPFEAELDTSALFNAAAQSGLLHEEGAQVLVHVGETTTSVVVADGGRLQAMRSIHTGAEPLSLPADEPEDFGDEDGDEFEDEAPAAPRVDEAELARRRAAGAERLRRELARTVSAANTENPIEGIFVTGLQLPELFSGPILEVPVEPFTALPGEDETDGVGECAVAYGAALRRLGGGVLRGTLRREELRYTGKFERLELPLAVLGLLVLMSLWVQLTILDQKIGWRGEGDPLDERRHGDMQLWLVGSNLFMLGDEDRAGRLAPPPDGIANYAKRAQRGEDTDRTKMEELKEIQRLLMIEVDNAKRELGVKSSVEQPQSALEAMTMVLTVIEGMGDDIGRVAIRQISSDTALARGGKEDFVTVKLDMDFFAENDIVATRNFEKMRGALNAEPWVREFKEEPSKPFEQETGATGVYLDNLTIEVDTTKIPDDVPVPSTEEG